MDEYRGNYKFLQESFATEQDLLIAHLKTSGPINHPGDKGEVNERHFIDFLRKYLPNRYTVDKATVLDSEGNVSDSIDIVVFDRQYTPTLLDINNHRYVPAEAVYAVFECKPTKAVYAVFECKPTINKSNLDYAAKKIESVRKLKRTSVEIHHAGGVFPAKKLFSVVGGILAIYVEWSDGFGRSFLENHKGLVGDKRVDCGFAAKGACFDIFSDSENFSYTFGPSQNALAYFAFRLLWKLQTLATVPAVDWMAYAKNLSRPISENEDELKTNKATGTEPTDT